MDEMDMMDNMKKVYSVHFVYIVHWVYEVMKSWGWGSEWSNNNYKRGRNQRKITC